MKAAVLIPAYKPDKNMMTLLSELQNKGFYVLVVNDGSPKEFDSLFSQAEKYAPVCGYRDNRGKGAALKYGYQKIIEIYPDCTHIITADCDGQHSVEDICKVRKTMENGKDFVLTTRYLRGKIPTRSRIGNSMSRFVYSILNANHLDDNQSGLRGFDICHIDWMLEVGGEKYDYEMNVLFYASKQKIHIEELPIKTIYIDGNKSSNFKPVRDTLRIYKRVFYSSRASLFFLVLSLAMVLFCDVLFSWEYFFLTIPYCVLFCAFLRYLTDKLWIFKNIDYKSSFLSFLRNLLRCTTYIAICAVFGLLGFDMFLSFLIAVISIAILEYYCRKTAYIIFNKCIKKQCNALSNPSK